MNKKVFIYVLFAVTPLLLVSCSKSPTAPNNTGNLISNPDFKSNGSPSLAGWAINDTARVKVVSNAPPGVTTWSLWTAPAGSLIPGGVATTYVTGESGQGIYRFSCAELNMAHWYWGIRDDCAASERDYDIEPEHKHGRLRVGNVYDVGHAGPSSLRHDKHNDNDGESYVVDA